MGGTIGVAAFLSLLFTRLGTEIPEQIRKTVEANPEAGAQALQLQQAGADSVLADTSGINAYPALVHPFRVGFSNTLDLVFLVAALVVAVGFFVLLFLPQLPLRTMSGIQAAQQAAAAAAAAPAGVAGAGPATMSQAEYERDVQRQAREMAREQREAERERKAQARAEAQARRAAERRNEAILRSGTRILRSRAGQSIIRGVFGTLFGGKG